MKIIDRYLLRMFSLPLIVCFLAFTMVYVVIDLYNNFGDFLEGNATVSGVLAYYVQLIPASLNYLVPVSLILAELWCLSTLTKHSELTAMRACGVSLVRLMAPFLAVGLIASVAVLAVNETVGPDAAYRTRQFVRSQRKTDKEAVYRYGPLPYKNIRDHRIWWIGEFNARTFEMKNVVVVQQDDSGNDLFKITAQTVSWLDGRWWFSDLNVQFFDEFNSPRGPPRTEKGREMADLTESPQIFLNEVKDPEFLSAYDLWNYVKTRREISREAKRRFRVDMHSRLALPWGCLMVTLLGVPFGNQTGRRGAVRGVMLCLMLFFFTYVFVQVGVWAGKMGLAAPWIAGWTPILAMFGVGAVLTTRMR